MAMANIAERRKLNRFSVRLKVFEQNTGELLGYAEDLHTEGLKLMSKNKLPVNKEMNIWLDKDEENIPLTVYCVWTSFSDTVPVYYYSGMHFVDPTEEVLDSIQSLLDDLKK